MARVLTVLWLFCCPLWVFAETVYRVGVSDFDYRPLYWTDEHGEYQGLLREMLDNFAQAHELRFEYLPIPNKRLLPSLQQGIIDVRLPDNPSWVRHDKSKLEIHYSQPLLSFTEGALVRRDDQPGSLQSLTSLAVLRGFTPVGYQGHNIQLMQMADMAALINMVVSGRTDAGYVNFLVAETYLSRPPGNRLLLSQSLPSHQSQYHASSIRYPQLLKQLDAFLRHQLTVRHP